MRRWLAAGLVAVLLAGGCGDDDTALTTTTSTSTSTTTTTAIDGTCDDLPRFGTTWLPEEWVDQYLLPGSGGSDDTNCGVHHWGGDGRFVDVRPGDGGFVITPDRARAITVLGAPATIGPIHEGIKVQTEAYSLLGYGIEEEVLERIAVGLYPFGPPVAPEATEDPVPDGLHAARLLAVDDGTVTVDLIGWYTGEEANRLAAERGDESPVPNDYYTVNDDPATPALPVDDAVVVVTSPWAEYGRDGCELCQRVITYDRLRELFTGPAPEPPQGNVRHSPYWITVHDGGVTRIDEQYVP